MPAAPFTLCFPSQHINVNCTTSHSVATALFHGKTTISIIPLQISTALQLVRMSLLMREA